jgi:hypothetical protein
VRLRITEVDNQFFFQVGIDNVAVSGGSGTASVALSAVSRTTGDFDMRKAVYVRR